MQISPEETLIKSEIPPLEAYLCYTRHLTGEVVRSAFSRHHEMHLRPVDSIRDPSLTTLPPN